MMIVIFFFLFTAMRAAGMERYEFEMEFIGVWRCKGFKNSSASTVEARCAHVQ